MLSASFWQRNFDKYSEAEQSAKDKAILENSSQSSLGGLRRTSASKYLSHSYSPIAGIHNNENACLIINCWSLARPEIFKWKN